VEKRGVVTKSAGEPHFRAGNFLKSPAPEMTIDAQPISESPGTVIGSYKLLEQIGEGGFGVVFMAEQHEPIRRKVALKVLKPGMDSKQVIARFEAERQALALMEHPNITRVHDGGATASGRPYFVMELVKGQPITEFCDQNQLTPKERLELFVHVCQAVQHAHQKGIIHRDLKPSNVLVSRHDTTPAVKVIDFGVAKALGQNLTDKTLFTGIAQMIGTPLYMSPEQAGMSDLDVDTRSDIYSLGVLLYELVTGTTPFTKERLKEASYDEMRRIIREEEPPRPSTRISTLGQAATPVSTQRKSDPKRLSQLVRGELDWIVMKALEKDRSRRYETANGFAMDVQRYLADEPVLACPPSAGYRFRKTVRRHKVALAISALVAACALILAGVGGWMFWQRELAVRGTEAALTDATDAQKRRDWRAARAALDRAEALLPGWGSRRVADRLNRIRTDLDTLDRIEEFRLNLGSGNKGHGPTAADEDLYREAFLRLGVDPDKDGPERAAEQLRGRTMVAEFAAAMDEWAWVRRKALKQEEAHWKPLLETARLADDDPTRIRVREAAAAGDWTAVRKLAEEIHVAEHPPLSLAMIGVYLAEAGDDHRPVIAFLRQARLQYPDDFWINTALGIQLCKPMRKEAYTEAIACYSAALVVRPRSIGALRNLAGAYIFSGNYDQGIALSKRILDFDISTAERAYALQQIAQAYRYKADHAHALAAIDESLKLIPDHPGSHHTRGLILLTQDPDAALAEGEEVVRLSGGDAFLAGSGHELIALAFANKRQFEKAAASMREALRLGHKLPASEAIMRDELGHMLMDMNDYAGALAEFRAASKLEPDFTDYQFSEGKALCGLGRYAEAKAPYLSYFQSQKSIIPEGYTDLGRIFMEEGKPADAEAAYRTAALMDPKNASLRYNLGLHLSKLHRYPEAIDAFREAIAINPDVAAYHCDLSTALQLSRKAPEGLKEARAAVALCDKDRTANKPGCLLELGTALHATGDPAAAVEVYHEAMRLKPGYAEAYDNLGIALVSQQKVGEAITAYRKALELNRDLPFTRGNLAAALTESGRPGEALPLLEEAVSRNPQDARAFGLLGVAKNRLGDLPGAEAALRQAIDLSPRFAPVHLELGFVLRRQGRFAESLVAFTLGRQFGPGSPDPKNPSAQWVREAERMLEQDAKLPAVLKGELKPRDGRERIEYADVAMLRKQFAAVARLYEQAFADEPALAESLELAHRYDAACYAALAGCGQGGDAGTLDDKERARLRGQALAWLRADLTAWKGRLEKEPAKARLVIARKLRHWQEDADLAHVRGAEALKKWSDGERRAWQQLWDDVEALLRRTTDEMK
jgi:serine/threonine protein kinase/tetratricopeptide (TPR) repeat protein